MIWWKPRFALADRLRGTGTSSSTTSRVSEECQPILRSGRPIDRPRVPRSTTNKVMPRCPVAAPVRAATTNTSARPALVMNILRPSSTQPSPVRRAVVVMPATSEPVPGSVTAMAATASPAASGASQRLRCCVAAVPDQVRAAM